MRRVAIASYEDSLFFLASALAFDALLALLPLTLLLLAAMGYVAQASIANAGELHELFQRFLPAHSEGLNDPFAGVERVFVAVVDSRNTLSLYGVPLFLWFATRLFGSLRVALNDVFDTDESRSVFAALGLDFLMVLVSGVLFFGYILMAATTAGLPTLDQPIRVATAFVLGLLWFFLIYLAAPSRRVRWDTAFVAAVVAAVGFELAKQLYGLYLREFATIDRLFTNSNVLAAILFVLWVYYTACIFLIGAEAAEAYDSARRQRQQWAILT